jgi:hypothetical protein
MLKNGTQVASGHPPGDEAKITRFLSIAGEDHPPAAISHGHDVIVAGMDVESLAGQGPGPDVHDHRQPLAGNRVQNFLHQHQSLAGGEIGHAAAGYGKTFADARSRVFALRLEKHEGIAPEVFLAVHHRSVKTAAHGRRTGDRIRSRRLTDVRLHMHDRFRTVAGGGNAGIFKGNFRLFSDGLGDTDIFAVENRAHGFSFPRQAVRG